MRYIIQILFFLAKCCADDKVGDEHMYVATQRRIFTEKTPAEKMRNIFGWKQAATMEICIKIYSAFGWLAAEKRAENSIKRKTRWLRKFSQIR